MCEAAAPVTKVVDGGQGAAGRSDGQLGPRAECRGERKYGESIEERENNIGFSMITSTEEGTKRKMFMILNVGFG